MELKLLEWNIHKMTNNIPVKQFVIDTLITQKADIICLVEYLDDRGIENAIQNNGYYFVNSDTISGNKILIAIKIDIAPEEIVVVNKSEVKNCYNFLHISIELNNEKKISIIGVRMLSPIDAKKQTPPLVNYLSGLKEPFLCTGDFNIHNCCMERWFKNFPIENIIHTDHPLWDKSIIYVNRNNKIVKGFGAVDHIIYGNGINIQSSVYDWSFLSCDKVYPKNIVIDKTVWDIPAAYPDHALMVSNLII